MILHISGTSGTGKSHIARELLRRGAAVPHYGPGATQDLLGQWSGRPLGYYLATPRGRAYVMGHYEVPSGGCDRLLGSMGWSRADVFARVRSLDDIGVHVIFEGLISTGKQWLLDLHAEGRPLRVVHLDVPLAECVAAIQARRDLRGDDRPLSDVHTVNKMKELQRHLRRWREAGIDVWSGSRAEAMERCLDTFGWGGEREESGELFQLGG
jgi:hypothetical protein